MQPEIEPQPDLDEESPDLPADATDGGDVAKEESPLEVKTDVAPDDCAPNQFPPPKTDKPRPHVCGTCSRSFARLEHLKRHERSHTKEKPFECPECSRCFARRDLLLRHQQKLHATNNTSNKQKGGRRESVNSNAVAGGRVRKNSVANANGGSSAGLVNGHSRPRANTISHIDLSGLGFMNGANPNFSRMNALGLMGPLGGLQGPSGFDYHGMSSTLGNHPSVHALPKLNTQAINNNMDMMDAMRTAPPQATFGGFDIDQLFSPGTTINPAHLHSDSSGMGNQPNLPPMEPFTVHSAIDPKAGVDDFGWMRGWNMQHVQDNNEQAIEESSPSRVSSGDSPSDMQEISNSGHGINGISMPNNFQWSQHDESTRHSMSAGPFQLDMLGSGLPNLDPPQATIAPDSLHHPTPHDDAIFHQAILTQQQQQQQQQQQRLFQQHHDHQISQEVMQGSQQNFFPPPISNFSSDSPSIMSSSSMAGSARQSSVTSASTSSITDSTRQALLLSLSQPSVFGSNSRKYSQPSISSPLSPSAGRLSPHGPSLPSTADIRRFVDAFIQFGLPHMPVTHIPTLSFDSLDHTSNSKGSPSHMNVASGTIGAGGCLILGMAAVGALYEYEHPTSKELFEASKKMISLYLEERRKLDMSAAQSGLNSGYEQQTPLWLVQAMLLNVIYGHMCGDKMAADIASNHCAALVSLARAAKLAQPPKATDGSHSDEQHEDVDMNDGNPFHEAGVPPCANQEMDLQTRWLVWKLAEERKRTLFAIFMISSLLTTAYNQNPTIMNSEILLDLPCDEDLFAAETAEDWENRGGLAAANQNAISFASALSTLLTANQRESGKASSNSNKNNGLFGGLQTGERLTEGGLRPSTFGCLVLINALHNYIWETRSRHHGRQWTPQETESMFSHIEPALSAWQAAWKANEQHTLERPNPLGLGPLAADSIPLLDLAFVRLFVNLGRSKEAFWQRDFDTMVHELARGSEIIQHAAGLPGSSAPNATNDSSSVGSPTSERRQSTTQQQQQQQPGQSSSRRERHLRKAAFYAADSLAIACGYNLTYTDMTAHELPIQSAMCFFDCCQVLAEWACTIQERVGQYLGVIGRDPIDFSGVPAVVLLEPEDFQLLGKIEAICKSLEEKRFHQEHLLGLDLQTPGIGSTGANKNVNLGNCGWGSKLLRITGMMLEKAVVWPITHVMAKALETQAVQIDQRSEASTTTQVMEQ